MRRLRQWLSRLRGTFHPRDHDARLDEEIRFHLEMHARRDIEAGANPSDARRAAVAAFGGREPWREAARDELRERNLEGAWQDLRFAVRTLRKAPSFTIVALLTFALGIGATTSVFSVVSGIVLRPLPYADPGRLAAIWPQATISNAELDYLQAHAKTFTAVAAFSPGWGIALTGSGEPRQLDAARVSTNFFDVLGRGPAIGRAFARGESSPGTWDVAILSHALWVSQFGADPAVVGRIVQMDGTPTRVVGVMPAGFEAFQAGVDAWLPLQVDPASRFYKGQTALAFGRLSPTATLASATAELATFVLRMRAAFNYTDDYGRTVTVADLHDSLVGNVRQSLLVLLGAAAFVLLIAGANVGNLSLVHAIGRRRELAVRRALGATRAQVARQMLVQSILIAAIGGALGTSAGVAGVRALKALLPHTLPMLSSVSVDMRVLAASAGLTILVGLVFGIAPAVMATRVDPEGVLRASSGGGSGQRSGVAARRALVVVEVALAMVLVVGAGLMTESLWRLSRVDLGFEPRNVLSFRIQPSSGQVASAEQTSVYFDEMVRRIAAQPGVERVGGVQHLPLSGFNWNGNLDIERRPIAATAAHPRVVWRSVIGDYFGAMQIPLRSGRLFTAADTRDAPPVLIVNETMAHHFWGDQSPIGERIRVGSGSQNDWATIVGVVGDVRFKSPNAPPGDEVYRPNAQQGLVFMHFVVRTAGDPLARVPDIRRAIRSLDGTVPIASVQALGALYAAATATPRTIALLLAAFAGAGLLLAAIGIYGVIAYSVSQRTRELGIRTALGALEGRIVTMVLGDGVRLALIGIVVGGFGAVFAARALRTLVFGVTTSDAGVYATVAAVLAAAAVIASYIPARRAARVDPLVALRSE